jgi:hypothetical protein
MQPDAIGRNAVHRSYGAAAPAVRHDDASNGNATVNDTASSRQAAGRACAVEGCDDVAQFEAILIAHEKREGPPISTHLIGGP